MKLSEYGIWIVWYRRFEYDPVYRAIDHLEEKEFAALSYGQAWYAQYNNDIILSKRDLPVNIINLEDIRELIFLGKESQCGWLRRIGKL